MRLVRYLDRLMAILAVTMIAATAVITCLAVFFRLIVGASLPWPEELTGNMLVWTSFVGAYLASRDRGHIAFELLVDKLPAGSRNILRTINDMLLVGFFALLAWLSCRVISVVGGTSLQTLPVPKGVFMASIPICSVALILAVLIRTAERWRDPPHEGPHEGPNEWSEPE